MLRHCHFRREMAEHGILEHAQLLALKSRSAGSVGHHISSHVANYLRA